MPPLIGLCLYDIREQTVSNNIWDQFRGLQLCLRPRVVSLQPELLALQEQLLDLLHPLAEILLEPLLTVLLLQQGPGVVQTLDGEGFSGEILDEDSLLPHHLRHTEGAEGQIGII